MRGPLLAEDLREPDGTMRRIPGSWFGTVPRTVLEAHFARGSLAIANRQPNFARSYDLSERLVPEEHYTRRVDRHAAQRELLRVAGQAMGIAAATDLADYFRMPMTEARPRLKELVEAGELREVTVEEWRVPAYLYREAVVPPAIHAESLLSPFDPVVWYRPRVARLFEFEYRFEIFIPESKRRWGCYVLPFLMGDRLVARVDLQADRTARRLRVPGAYVEPGVDAGAVAEALARELAAWAGWLGLETIGVEKRTGFNRYLRAAVREAKR